MRKLILKITILAVLGIVYISFDSIAATVSFEAGKNFLHNKDYKQAYLFLKTAVNNDPDNIDYLNFYTEALLGCNKTEEIQRELTNVVNLAPSSNAAELARIQLAKLKKQLLEGIGENYIESATYGSDVLHWNLNKMPLKVFIGNMNQSYSLPSYYLSSINQAVSMWITALGSPFNYQIVDNPDIAEIQILFVPEIYESRNGDNYSISNGSTTPVIENSILKRMDIKLRAAKPDNQPYSEIELYNTTLHEMGHALGIMGHSYNSSDIMYPITYDKRLTDIPYSYQIVKLQLSNRDINTIRLLHRLNADISNYNPNNPEEKIWFDGNLVLGDKKTRTDLKLKEAEKYVQTVSNNPMGWTTLGIAYYEAKRPDDAIKAIYKALDYVKSKQEIADIYYNMAMIYYESENYPQAINYIQKSLESNPNMILAKELEAVLYLKLNYFEQGEAKYKDLIAKDPQNINYSMNLVYTYIDKGRLIKAGRILNSLITANPEAKNDARVKRLMILAFLFK